MKKRVLIKRPYGNIPLLNNALLSLWKSRYRHATLAFVLTSNSQRILVKKSNNKYINYNNLSFKNLKTN